MDITEVVDEILEAVHTEVSDDAWVNERAARAAIYGLIEDAVAEIERPLNDRIHSLEREVGILEDDLLKAEDMVKAYYVPPVGGFVDVQKQATQ